MGYEVYIQKFEDGDSSCVPFEDVVKILSKYGNIEEGSFGLEFVSSVGEVCEYAPIHGDKESGVSGISFNRPTLHEKLPQIIFDLLQFENTCFFGPDLEFVHSRYEMKEHYPLTLIENLPNGPKVIKSPVDEWPLS